ncbi:MAG: porin, partial [Pseudorhodoplanes sp.]
CTGCYSLSTNLLWGDTGGSGTPVAAYTAQFGNGVSATLSIEDNTERRNPVVNLSFNPTSVNSTGGIVTAAAFTAGVTNTSSQEGYKVPDIVGALRVDQAWGSAQISGAAHYLAGTYYANAAGTNQNQANGHPGDTWGWAANAGLTLKMPWDPKDTLSMQGTYCDGATRYCMNNNANLNPNSGLVSNLVNTSTVATAWSDDAYYVNGGGLEKSKMWSVVAAFEHYWTPSLRQSVYGGYNSYETDSASVDAQMCGGGSGCMDWSAWQIGSRLLWNPVANLDIGLDVMYTNIDGTSCARSAGAAGGGVAAPSCATANPGAPISSALNLGDAHVWSGIFRVQRNFWP